MCVRVLKIGDFFRVCAALIASLVISAALLLSPLFAGAATAGSVMSGGVVKETVQDAARHLSASKRALDLQTEISVKGDEEIRQGFWDRTFSFPSLPEMASFIFYGAIAVILVVICLTIRDNLWSLNRSRRLDIRGFEGSPQAVASTRMKHAQAEADDLARRGDFAEAMHLLLLQSVEELRGYLSISIASSLTSREILRRVLLSAEGRAAFSDIIARVEVSYFGTHRPGAEEYTACRRSFDMLTELLRGGLLQ
ncbi:MAG: hypothetical protein LBT08_11535 [Synergistaceae bacterium]|jgi:hypothetical protein|nr:hypothetical protein [Synergistaceae bacterium]